MTVPTNDNLRQDHSHQYIGRFAPSPTGPLHFGSLVAALASYLDARHHGGRWLLRIEDLDPPREQAGAATAILKCLEAHQLFWDGEVMFQSQRHDAYAHTLSELQQRGLIYPCYCTRKGLATVDGPYPGTCRQATPRSSPHALRLLTSELPAEESTITLREAFNDLLVGPYRCQQALGDFIVRRKDGLFAYQLAVVVDDIYQGITDVIRGVDLIGCSPSQIFLFECLQAIPPRFGHVPMALNDQRQKLGKQHGAQPLNEKHSRNNLRVALQFLNHAPKPEMAEANEGELLNWAVDNWDRCKLPRKNAVIKYQ